MFLGIDKLIMKVVIRRISEMLTEFIKPILDLIKTLVQPQQGTKFLITIAALGAIYVLQSQKIGDMATTITIGCIVVAYYVADIYHKGRKGESK